MDFPEFRDDQEMAEWFEANEVDPASLEVANDVTISPDLTVTLIAQVYSVHRDLTANAAGSNAAVTTKGQRVLTPAID